MGVRRWSFVRIEVCGTRVNAFSSCRSLIAIIITIRMVFLELDSLSLLFSFQ